MPNQSPRLEQILYRKKIVETNLPRDNMLQDVVVSRQEQKKIDRNYDPDFIFNANHGTLSQEVLYILNQPMDNGTNIKHEVQSIEADSHQQEKQQTVQSLDVSFSVVTESDIALPAFFQIPEKPSESYSEIFSKQ